MTITAGESVLVHARTELALFLRERMREEGIHGQRELAEKIKVAQATAGRLLNKRVVPSVETLAKIAEAFDVPVTEVREMADRPTGELDPFIPPPDLDLLTERQRARIIDMGREMLRASGMARTTR